MTGEADADDGMIDRFGPHIRLAASAVLDAVQQLLATTAVHPDAELLTACLVGAELWRRHSAAFHGPTRIVDDDERERVVRPIWDEAEPVLRTICELPATTMDGHQARAATLLAWDAGALLIDQDAIESRLVLALAADLVANPRPATSVTEDVEAPLDDPA